MHRGKVHVARTLPTRLVLSFLKNDAARDSLIKGYSAVRVSSTLIGMFWLLELETESLTWFSRVPSASNVADGPSRIDFSITAALGAEVHEPVLPPEWRG